MVGTIRDFFVKHIVAEVPDELSACLDCGFVQCLNEKWDNCSNRLARAAALCALHTGENANPAEAAEHEAPPPADPGPTTPPV